MGSQEMSSTTPLQVFESKLFDAKSGDRVFELVDRNENIADLLNEMISDPSHSIPFSDHPYLLYRFHMAVNKQDIWKRYCLDDAHYKIAFLKGKIEEIEKTIHDLEHPPEGKKGLMQVLGSIFTGSAETKRQLDAKAAEKTKAQTDLINYEAKLTRLQDEVEKIEKFMDHFNVKEEIKRLKKLDAVKNKLAEEAAEKEAEEKERKERKSKKAKHIKWGGIKNF